MKYIVENANLDILNLTDEYKFVPDGSLYDPSVDYFPRYGQFGTNDQGDGKMSKRVYGGSITIVSKTDSDYLDKANKFASFFSERDKPFYLIDTDNDRRTRIRLNKNNLKWISGNVLRTSDAVPVEFQMVDALWEDNTETNVNVTLANNGTTSITIPNSYEECYPIIEVTNLGPLTQDNFSIEVTNNFRTSVLVVEEPTFPSGDVIKLDCQNGKATIQGININAKITNGSFFPFYKGVNTIKYSCVNGQGVTLDIAYRKRRVH